MSSSFPIGTSVDSTTPAVTTDNGVVSASSAVDNSQTLITNTDISSAVAASSTDAAATPLSSSVVDQASSSAEASVADTTSSLGEVSPTTTTEAFVSSTADPGVTSSVDQISSAPISSTPVSSAPVSSDISNAVSSTSSASPTSDFQATSSTTSEAAAPSSFFETSSTPITLSPSVSETSILETISSADTTVILVITSTSTILPSTTSSSLISSSTEFSSSSSSSLVSSTFDTSTVFSTSQRISASNTAASTSPSTTQTSASSTSSGAIAGSTSGSSSGLSSGAIIAIAVAVPVGVLAILGVAGYFLWRHHKSAKAAKSQRLAEVNDYSFNPNSASALNMSGGGGSGGGTAPMMAAGGTAGGAAAGNSQTSNNYRGWGPAPTSPQMEQVPSSSLAHVSGNGMNGYNGTQMGAAKGAVGAAAIAGTAAAAVAGSASSSGGDNTVERGSDEMIMTDRAEAGQPGVSDPHSSQGYYSPSGNEIFGGGYEGTDDRVSPVMGAAGASQQHYENENQYPRGNYDQQQRQQASEFDFNDPVEYYQRQISQSPTNEPTPKLKIQNVEARRDSPNIEYGSWPHLSQESSGTPGVSQNF